MSIPHVIFFYCWYYTRHRITRKMEYSETRKYHDDFTAVLPIATKSNPSRSALFSIRDTSLHFAIVENSQGMLSGSVTKSRFCMCVCCSIILLYFQYNSPWLQPQR